MSNNKHSLAHKPMPLDALPDERVELAMLYLRFLRRIGRSWFVRPNSEQYFVAIDLKACGYVTVVPDSELPCFKIDLVRRAPR
jgi:hypothetical protein